MDQIYSYPSDTTIGALLFTNYTSEEIRRLSVKELTSAQAIDRLGAPVPGGPYDLALGPFDKNDRCFTCGQGFVACPGHLGHISLVLPVYNPVFFRNLVNVTNDREKCSSFSLIFPLASPRLLPSLSHHSLFQCREISLFNANALSPTWINQ